MQYIRTVLPNGLRVITIPMPSFESATVLVMAGVGSRYETQKNSGISHFLEHMAFKGTEKRPSALEIANLIDGIGGEFNAFTSKEITGYYIKSQANHIELSLDILSDMLQHSKFDPTEIDKEKGVIIEEINMYEDTPMRKIGDMYERLLYGDTPMGWDIAGTKETVMGIAREDFIKYINTFYSPSNMTVVIAGGIDALKVPGMIEKYFGTMKRFDTPTFEKVLSNQTTPAVMLKQKETEQVHVALGVRTVPVNSDERYPLAVLASILGGGMSSRLFHEVRERRGLAYYIRTHSDHYEDSGSLVTVAGVDTKRTDDAVKVILEEYEKVKTTAPVTDEEVKKAKEYLNGHLVLELEDSRAVAGYYAHQELLENELLNPADTVAKINAVMLDQVMDVARRYINHQTLNLAVIGNFSDSERFQNLLK